MPKVHGYNSIIIVLGFIRNKNDLFAIKGELKTCHSRHLIGNKHSRVKTLLVIVKN